MSLSRSGGGLAVAPETVSGNYVTDPIKVGPDFMYSLHLIHEGTLEGSVLLQASNDPSGEAWSDIDDSTGTLTGADENILWNVTNAGYRFVRIKFTHSAGTGLIKVWRYAKG